MLPPFIIEQIKKREQDQKRRRQQPVVELPLSGPPYFEDPNKSPPNEESERGVLIIDL